MRNNRYTFREIVRVNWTVLPMRIKQMWWAETDYGRFPERASEYLHDSVRATMEAILVQRWRATAQSIAALSASASMARLETGIGGYFD